MHWAALDLIVSAIAADDESAWAYLGLIIAVVAAAIACYFAIATRRRGSSRFGLAMVIGSALVCAVAVGFAGFFLIWILTGSGY